MVNGYTTASAANIYRQGQITHAEPIQLIIMLYEGALQRIKQAEEELTKGNQLAAGIAIYRTLPIIAELRRSLNPEAGGDLAESLDRLYLYVHEELVKANLERRADRLAPVRTLLADLRDAWTEAANQVRAAAVQAAPAVPTQVAEGEYARVLVKA